MREINTETLIGDMMIGDVDVAYSTYLGYDEIAHHSGVRDEDVWFALKGMDKQIKRLLGGNKYSPRQYQFVIQSDHGQTNGATFKQRYGESFEDFVKSLLPLDVNMYANMSSNEDHFAEVYVPFSDKFKAPTACTSTIFFSFIIAANAPATEFGLDFVDTFNTSIYISTSQFKIVYI